MASRNLLPAYFLVIACSATWCDLAHANPKTKKNSIGPTITFGNGQSIVGVEGRFHITDNIAIRPSYSFVNLAGAGATVVGGSATYEFNIEDSEITPFVGMGVNFYTVNESSKPSTTTTGFAQAGMDVSLNQNITVTGDVKVPFDSKSVLGTVISVGAGYRF